MIEPKDRTLQLREFGQVMAAALIVLGGVLLWKLKPTALICFSAALVFLCCVLFCPALLGLL